MTLPSGRSLCLWLSGLFSVCLYSHAHGLELEAVWEKSLKNHPTIQMHAAAARSGALDVESARQQFWPTPSVSLERVSSGPLDNVYGSSANLRTLRLQQPVWTGGRLTAGVEKAEAALKATEVGAEDAKLQLLLKGLQYWSEWWSNELKLKAAQLSRQTHTDLLEQMSRRVDQGASAPTDLELTRGRFAQLDSVYQNLMAQDRAARMRLAQITGEPVPEKAIPVASQLNRPLADMVTTEQAVLDSSYALKKVQAQLLVQQAEAKEIASELKPEVYLRIERTHSDNALSSVANLPTRVFLGVNSRFGAGLSSFKRVESVTERLRATQLQLEEAKVNLREQFAADWTSYQSAVTRLPLLQAAFNSTEQSFESANRQFLAGRKSWLEVMNSAREVQQAAFELADVKVAVQHYHWRLVLMTHPVDELMAASKSK